MSQAPDLRFSERQRVELWQATQNRIETYFASLNELAVTPPLDVAAIRQDLQTYDFEQGVAAQELLEYVCDRLTAWQVHTPHPAYFGLFNPAPTTMGIVADQLVAAFNPQLAAWSHSPFANEVERHLVRAIGQKFGYPLSSCDGVFCSGGAEANHTALLTALTAKFPLFATQGVRALPAQPVFYVGSQSHHSFVKAARFCGLGTQSVRVIPHDANLLLNGSALAKAIQEDRAAGVLPFMVVATAGTTSGGLIDPIGQMVELAQQNDLWCHVDSAWGGAAVFVPELKPYLGPIHQADSITFDCHKWLSVPMGAGLYLTRHPTILEQTCHMHTEYMPRDGKGLDVHDPYTHSLQWSRRFIGLKVFMSLAQAGWSGYADVLRHQATMGRVLRQKLSDAGWVLVNQTPLPVVCFHSGRPDHSFAIAQAVNDSGRAWISPTYLDPEVAVIRACITNFQTTEAELDQLVEALAQARAAMR